MIQFQVVVDDQGDVTGIPGNILEQHLNLSKATDTIGDGTFPTRTYYKDYILENSQYIFAGGPILLQVLIHTLEQDQLLLDSQLNSLQIQLVLVSGVLRQEVLTSLV